jgi:O-antigen/teichoic acid export membrane protein
VVAVALTVGLVVAGAELLPFFAVFPLAGLAALLLTTALVRGEGRLVPGFDRAECAALLRDALPYAAATAFGIMYYRVALIVSSVTAAETQTGYFSVAFRIQEIVIGVAWVLVPAAFPILARAARDDPTRLRYALQRLLDASLIVGLGLAVLTAVGAPFAVRVVGGPDYAAATDVLRIESIATLPSFLVATWGFALLSRRKHMELLVANAAAFLLTVGLSLELIHGHGAKGAAVAVVATEAFLAIVYGLFLMLRHPALRVSTRLAPRVVLAAALAAAVGFLLPAPDLVRLVAATATYAIALVTLRTISADVWRSLGLRA